MIKQKQLLIIGIITILICIELSGCTTNTTDINDIYNKNSDVISDITIQEIELHPYNYINKNITIQAIWIMQQGGIYSLMDDTGVLIIGYGDEYKWPDLIRGAEYVFTGIILYGQTVPSAGERVYMRIHDVKNI